MLERASANRKALATSFRALPVGIVHLTARQAEVLQLAVRGLSGKQIARHLGISARTVEGHFSAMRQRAGAHNQSELVAYGVAAGLVNPEPGVPETVISGTATMPPRPSETRLASPSRNRVPPAQFKDRIRDDQLVSIPSAPNDSVQIGYARLSSRAQDHRAQLSALANAQYREIIIDIASSMDVRPGLLRALGMLRPGDTLVIYTPDRVARSVNELIVFLEDQLRADGINLHILSGICAGLHRPDGATIADKTLFMVAAIVTEMKRNLIREHTLDGQHTAGGQGRRGRPAIVNDDVLAIARARRERGESVTYIARDLGVGRSTLYRALNLQHAGRELRSGIPSPASLAA